MARRAAYLGPPASYTHQAALNFFSKFFPSETIELIPHTTFTDIFDTVQSSTTTWGVVPVENSSNGTVVQVRDLLADRMEKHSEVKVCAEYYLRVKHCLLGRKIAGATYKDIKKLYTHPQAWGQCTAFLDEHLKGVDREDTSSTSKAATTVAEEEEEAAASGIPGGRSAAIASKLAGELCGLDVLQEGIEDTGDNVTRFLILKKRSAESEEDAVNIATNGVTSAEDKKWKSLISFTIDHAAPGALADALGIFKKHWFNLTSIDTRPSRVRPWHYVFFVECEQADNGEDTTGIDGVMADLGQVTQNCRHLGSWRDELGQMEGTG